MSEKVYVKVFDFCVIADELTQEIQDFIDTHHITYDNLVDIKFTVTGEKEDAYFTAMAIWKEEAH